ncbi:MULTISPECIES: ComZ family protein [Alteribacillus]|uniref:Competence protein ComZ n=1 Tax=Alteribacillus bidgolensis TaxID=930129 RepID=A0A1G8J4K7_9BACI|nr:MULTISPECIES: ComZ family protein [Alteribacillus]SDI26195.1 competence protein ComZ [Alteribacillus bidgolensis]
MDQELNMRFMEIAMKHVQEGRAFLNEKGIELDMHDLQPALEMLMSVMNEAYNMGYDDAKKE